MIELNGELGAIRHEETVGVRVASFGDKVGSASVAEHAIAAAINCMLLYV